MNKKIKESPYRKIVNFSVATLVPIVIIGGYFYPVLGFLALVMMMIMMILMLFMGRWYCGWLCAMGSFHERIIINISRNHEVPELFKKTWIRWGFFILLMSIMFTRLIFSGGDFEKIGAVFVMMWTVATTIAIVIGVYYKPRSWCNFCPMGSVQAVIAPNSRLLKISSDCIKCGICKKVCPIGTYPANYKEQGYVPGIECIRCENCIANCPGKALSF